MTVETGISSIAFFPGLPRRVGGPRIVLGFHDTDAGGLEKLFEVLQVSGIVNPMCFLKEDTLSGRTLMKRPGNGHLSFELTVANLYG